MKTVARLVIGYVAILAVAGCVPAGQQGEGAEARRPEPAGSRPVAKAGELCGGFAGIHCESGLYCDYGDGTADAPSHCGANDQAGRCAPRPQMCTQQFEPVCGCDSKTHGNACAAHGRAVTVAKPGDCAT